MVEALKRQAATQASLDAVVAKAAKEREEKREEMATVLGAPAAKRKCEHGRRRTLSCARTAAVVASASTGGCAPSARSAAAAASASTGGSGASAS